jgi:hypothetical protein
MAVAASCFRATTAPRRVAQQWITVERITGLDQKRDDARMGHLAFEVGYLAASLVSIHGASLLTTVIDAKPLPTCAMSSPAPRCRSCSAAVMRYHAFHFCGG